MGESLAGVSLIASNPCGASAAGRQKSRRYRSSSVRRPLRVHPPVLPSFGGWHLFFTFFSRLLFKIALSAPPVGPDGGQLRRREIGDGVEACFA